MYEDHAKGLQSVENILLRHLTDLVLPKNALFVEEEARKHASLQAAPASLSLHAVHERLEAVTVLVHGVEVLQPRHDHDHTACTQTALMMMTMMIIVWMMMKMMMMMMMMMMIMMMMMMMVMMMKVVMIMMMMIIMMVMMMMLMMMIMVLLLLLMIIIIIILSPSGDVLS